MQISKNDHRNYCPITMENGTKVLLVHDVNCKKSAAAACIYAGHFDDPADIPGLSHLLEHVLFGGSVAFPEANGFDKFLASHGGNINAWTGTEYSNFHFDVTPNHFFESLERFVDLLFQPQFDLAIIEREIQAIDAEFKLKVKDDLRRLYQVHKETCNPAHPFSQFSVGNAQTLGVIAPKTLQLALKTLHKSCYLPSNMMWCLISNHSLDEMKVHLAKLLQPINFTGHKPLIDLPPLYLPDQLGITIHIKPIKQARRLILSFALPDVQAFYQTKPLEMISHLLGDEGQGSLLSFYKQRNWATNLSAGGGINGSNFKDFNVNLQMTELGLENLDKLLNALFYFLQLINQGMSENWRLVEKAKLGQLAFDYHESSKSIDDAIHLSNQMFHYPIEEVLSGDFLVSKLDANPVKDCLAYMLPHNMRIKLICPEAETDQIAKWYGTPYRSKAIPPEFLAKLAQPQPVSELKLPPENPYIVDVTDTGVVKSCSAIPRKTFEAENLRVWFAQDQQFNQPKGDCFISFDCQAIAEGSEVSAYKRLWVALMVEHFNDQFYQANVAGLHYHLYAHQGGFSLHTSGFSQKQLDLSVQIFKQIHATIDLQPMFEQVKNKQLNALQNSLMNKPINRLFTRLSGIVQRYTHAPKELLKHVETATIEDVNQVRYKLLDDYFIEVFLFGDWHESQSIEYAHRLNQLKRKSLNAANIKREVVDLTGQQKYLNQVSSQHDDAAVVLYIQTPTASTKDVALTILTEQLLASPFFNYMRNEKQLGYLAGSGYLPLNQHPGMAFYVQSPTVSSKILVDEIELFLNDNFSTISELEPIWQYVQASVVKQIKDNDTSLSVKSQRLWMAIGNQDHDFNQQENLAEQLLSLTFEDITQFCNAIQKSQQFGRLILYCSGKNQAKTPLEGSVIEDLSSFKQHANFII
ncbi:insulinase family protein [Aliiglaciecola sp. LCG003]|uniref:insulinase family protein n=1 Tax=Aliiglaciecola sp. LCG003 TaxID=3053655 RepID=UPI00257248FC|nr:insulinase family protein [Aliiglaciecola sp. LCG003]WJG10635.1 insulinase family protein [Aliiglaciecola sp. LCG003]